MTPGAFRARAGVLAAALLLALASHDARAGELYRWVTEDGRMEIGTNPPLGAAAEPWSPGQEAAAQPAPPASAAPEGATAVTRRMRTPTDRANEAERREAERRARGRLEETCMRNREVAAKAARKIAETETQIARLESRIEELEANAVAYSKTSCNSQGIEGPSSDCRVSSFHRDAEISRLNRDLEEAQQKLADIEQRARAVTEDERCAPAASDE